MNYLQTIRYLDTLVNYEKKASYSYRNSIKLSRMHGFLQSIGNPQRKFKSVHVAGTKGKGSVCVFTAGILSESGLRVGLYTSPHLSSVRERVRILKGRSRETDRSLTGFPDAVSRKELVSLVCAIKPKIERYNRICRYGALTFFEVYTALAFLYFAENGVDIAVLETGLGGRLDATNTADSLVCAITPISLDHVEVLGRTIGRIAAEKAGIIKQKHAVVVVSRQQIKASRVIRQRCRRMQARLYESGRDFYSDNVRLKGEAQEFCVKSVLGAVRGLKIIMAGAHQLDNAAMAVNIALALREHFGYKINDPDIRRGLSRSFWPARFECVRKRPWIILDVAHNPASALALRDTVERHIKAKNIILVFGASADKDIKGILKHLLMVSKRIILTASRNPRAASVKEVLAVLKTSGMNGCSISLSRSVPEAVRMAVSEAGPKDVVLIAGSVFLAAEARQELLHNTIMS